MMKERKGDRQRRKKGRKENEGEKELTAELKETQMVYVENNLGTRNQSALLS
jgi:hypothetical protein